MMKTIAQISSKIIDALTHILPFNQTRTNRGGSRMNTAAQITSKHIDVGTPSLEFQSKDQGLETVDVRFHGFESLPSMKGKDWTASPEFTCCGHQWRLKIFPGGEASSDDGYVGIYLCNRSDQRITLKGYGFRAKDGCGHGKADFASPKERSFFPKGSDVSIWGSRNFTNRSDLIKSLVEGTLVIEVRMMKAVTSPEPPFIPENPISKIILEKFMDEESADILFEVVGSGEGPSSGSGEVKRAKTSTTCFHAHRFILEKIAPELAVPSEPGTDVTVIPIVEVKPEIFRHILYYAYGGEIPDKDMKANAEGIMDASDRYGISSLKLKAEATLVLSTKFTMDSVMDTLLHADAKNCALLKEAAIDFLVENADEVMRRLSFNDAPGHLMKDLMAAVARGKKEASNAESDGKNDFSLMSVSTLRKRLHDKGLEVDGSREVMIARLREQSSGLSAC